MEDITTPDAPVNIKEQVQPQQEAPLQQGQEEYPATGNTGIIKSFYLREYGFIRPKKAGPMVFFSSKDFKDINHLKVTYDVIKQEDGRLKAVNIRFVSILTNKWGHKDKGHTNKGYTKHKAPFVMDDNNNKYVPPINKRFMPENALKRKTNYNTTSNNINGRNTIKPTITIKKRRYIDKLLTDS
jgi:hypothetical protein